MAEGNNRYRIRKIISRVEETIVLAESQKMAEQMLVAKQVNFGGTDHERKKTITFEIERINDGTHIQEG